MSISDGVAIVVGIVIGSAIFETPSLVAANTGDAPILIFVWVLGAAISVAGALCYAEPQGNVATLSPAHLRLTV